MAIVITVANEKGGTGKTTTAVNLAAGLALWGRYRRRNPVRVLFLDLDPSANALMSLGFKHHNRRPGESIYALLRETPPPSIQRLIETSDHHPNLSIVPSNTEAMYHLVRDEILSLPRRETRLERALRPVFEVYDYIVIDTPPSVGYMLANALIVSTHVLIPVKPEYYDIVGLQRLLQQINKIEVEFEISLEILGFLPTMVQRNLNINQEFLDILEQRFPGQVFPPIHLSSHIKIAHAAHQDIFTAYPPRTRTADQLMSSSQPTQEFAALIEEVIRRTSVRMAR